MEIEVPDVTVICDDLRFPEGPVWMDDGSIIVTEIASGTIRRCSLDGNSTIVADLGGGPNGAAVGPDGSLYLCNNGGNEHYAVPSRGWLIPGERSGSYIGGRIQRLDLTTETVIDLYTECGGRTLNGPNDLVFDSSGGFWFTDHGKTANRAKDQGGVYYATSDGSVIREILFPLDSPNGVGLSPDGTTLYVAETHCGRLWAWEVLEPGVLRTNTRKPAQGGHLLVGFGGYTLLDSLAVDSQGNICVARFGDLTGIAVVSPSGAVIRHVSLDDPFPTNVCFGGTDLRTAYATLSAGGRLVAWEWPVAGHRLH